MRFPKARKAMLLLFCRSHVSDSSNQIAWSSFHLSRKVGRSTENWAHVISGWLVTRA